MQGAPNPGKKQKRSVWGLMEERSEKMVPDTLVPAYKTRLHKVNLTTSNLPWQLADTSHS